MSDIKLFRVDANNGARKLTGSALAVEKTLQPSGGAARVLTSQPAEVTNGPARQG